MNTTTNRAQNDVPGTSVSATDERQALVKYLVDTHALINHGFGAVVRQRDNLDAAKDDAAAIVIIDECRDRLESQLRAIDARVTALGGSTAQPLKDAITTVTGFAAGVYNKLRPEEAARSVRDDYTFLSLLSVSYLMLFTTATSFGDAETAKLARHGYEEAARMIMDIDRLLPGIVLQSLRQDGFAPKDTTAETAKMIKDAWTRGAITPLRT